MGKFPEVPETHSQGVINIETVPPQSILSRDLGIQISEDGRVWICIDGLAFLRFNPNNVNIIRSKE